MKRQGVTVDTAGQSENGFTFNDVLGMLFLDAIIFSFLAWYAGHVRNNISYARAFCEPVLGK